MKVFSTWSLFLVYLVCSKSSLGQTLNNSFLSTHKAVIEDVLKGVQVASTQILNDHGCDLEVDAENLQDIQWWIDSGWKRLKNSHSIQEILAKIGHTTKQADLIRHNLELQREVQLSYLMCKITLGTTFYFGGRHQNCLFYFLVTDDL